MTMIKMEHMLEVWNASAGLVVLSSKFFGTNSRFGWSRFTPEGVTVQTYVSEHEVS
jgi:hypothetical protein